jgi:excisionase family DNA binding protein
MGSNVRIADQAEGQLLNLRQAADRLSVSIPTLYRLFESGELAWVKLGKARRVPLSSVLALVVRNTRGGAVGV